MSLLSRIEGIVREAGGAIMAIYDHKFIIEQKADDSPLTQADTAANQIIINALEALSPEIPILSEESVEQFNGPNDKGLYWLVDPLDGTKEFIKKNGEFTVNIALIKNDAAVLGVVYAPALDLMYSAEIGLGTFRTDSTGEKNTVHVASHMAGTPWKVVCSRSHGGGSLNEWLVNLGDHELIPMGSSLKFCLIADGKADLYPRLGPTSLWDTAAAQCVVEQAGGEVVQLDGTRLSYCNPKALLNPYFIARATTIENAEKEAI